MNCNSNHNTWSGTEGGEDTKPSRRGVVVSMRRKATIMRMAMILVGVMVVGTSRTHSSLGGAWAFSPHTVGHLPRSRSRIATPSTTPHDYDHSISRHASSKNSEPSTKNNDRDNNNKKVGELSSWKNEADELAKKTSWYAVELFGKVVGSMTNRGATVKDGDVTTMETPPIDMTRPPSSIQETLQRIQLDNDRAYFLSGQVDEELYALDCVFSDPFVSFQGRERFVTNLANLGSFITKYDAKVLSYNQEDATTIQTKVRGLNTPVHVSVAIEPMDPCTDTTFVCLPCMLHWRASCRLW